MLLTEHARSHISWITFSISDTTATVVRSFACGNGTNHSMEMVNIWNKHLNKICVDDWCIRVSFHWFEMPYYLRHYWTTSKGKKLSIIEKLEKRSDLNRKFFPCHFFPRFKFPFHLFSKTNFSSSNFVCKKSFQTNSKWRVSKVNSVNFSQMDFMRRKYPIPSNIH